MPKVTFIYHPYNNESGLDVTQDNPASHRWPINTVMHDYISIKMFLLEIRTHYIIKLF